MSWQVDRKNAGLMPLIIHPNGIGGMKNLMSVAQALGKKALHTENPIHVYPWHARAEVDGVNWFIVIVKEMGCTGTQVQGNDVV